MGRQNWPRVNWGGSFPHKVECDELIRVAASVFRKRKVLFLYFLPNKWLSLLCVCAPYVQYNSHHACQIRGRTASLPDAGEYVQALDELGRGSRQSQSLPAVLEASRNTTSSTGRRAASMVQLHLAPLCTCTYIQYMYMMHAAVGSPDLESPG